MLLTLLQTQALDLLHVGKAYKPFYVVGWLPLMNSVTSATRSQNGRPISVWFPWRVLDVVQVPEAAVRQEPDPECCPEVYVLKYEVRSLFCIAYKAALLANTMRGNYYHVGYSSFGRGHRNSTPYPVVDVHFLVGEHEVKINNRLRRYLKAMMCRHPDPFFSSLRRAMGMSVLRGLAFGGALPWDIELLLTAKIETVVRGQVGRNKPAHDEGE